MNRRGFFGLLGGMVASATLDQERLLWVPGKKFFSIPSVAADQPLLFDQITATTLMQLQRCVIEDNFFLDEKWSKFYRAYEGGGNIRSPLIYAKG